MLFSFYLQRSCYFFLLYNKSLAVAEMGDRLVTINISRREGAAVPLSGGSWAPSNNVAWAEIYLRVKWHLDPYSHFATIDMSQKVWGVLCPFLGELNPHLTQCRLGRGLPPYQMLYSSIFGHNRHGPKIGGFAPLGESWVPM